MEDEVAIRETMTFPLPMGIKRKDKGMGAGLQASKVSKAMGMRWTWLQPSWQAHSDFKGTGVCWCGR